MRSFASDWVHYTVESLAYIVRITYRGLTKLAIFPHFHPHTDAKKPMPMTVLSFSMSRLPQIIFGRGRIADLPATVSRFGRHVLLITGARAFTSCERWPRLLAEVEAAGLSLIHATIGAEPSPELVDELVARFKGRSIEAVVGIGGGSVLDAAKAVAGLLPFGNSVLDHLEGIGRGIPYQGPALPFIAVPTTAGTGSEATKNAVLSVRGEQGFKKSFRHDTLVPAFAIVDPDLLDTCPPVLIAANGMDALTQLLESYVSTRANAMTDALALSGLAAIRDGFIAAWAGGMSETAHAARSNMAYGALLSGITLAQAGLGCVHGLAAPLGAFFPIPHGVACGTTVAAATAANLAALRQRQSDPTALYKYAKVGRLLADQDNLSDTDAQNALVMQLERWAFQTNIPKLSHYGVTAAEIPRIVAHSRGNSMQTNPVVLTDEEIAQIVASCL